MTPEGEVAVPLGAEPEELAVRAAAGDVPALEDLLRDRVDSGEWAAADAERFAQLVAHANAERVYGLGA